MPTLPPIQQLQVFFPQGHIGGGVMKTTDLQQASMTVAKSWLPREIMSGLIGNCLLEMLGNQGQCCDGFFVPAPGSFFLSV